MDTRIHKMKLTKFKLISSILTLCLFISPISARSEGSTNRRLDRPRGDDESSIYCPPCDMRDCPIVSVESCDGVIMKDRCECCPICHEGWEDDAVEVIAETDLDTDNDTDACSGIVCERHEVCMRNIQDLPVCRCPNAYYCKSKPRGKVCGSDQNTYPSICLLKMAACEQGRKIAVQRKGACDRPPRDTKQERKAIREERLREKEEQAEARRREKAIKQELKREEKRQNKRGGGAVTDDSKQQKQRGNRKNDRIQRKNNRRNGEDVGVNRGTQTRAERMQNKRNERRRKNEKAGKRASRLEQNSRRERT